MNSKRQVMRKLGHLALNSRLPFALYVTLNLKIYATGHSSIEKIAIAPCVPRFIKGVRCILTIISSIISLSRVSHLVGS